MAYKLLSLCIFILLQGCAQVNPTIVSGFDTDSTRRKKLTNYFNALVELGQFNGVVLVKDDGSKTYLKSFNINTDEQSSSFVNINSQFDIHSVSKLMAKAILVDLESQGKLHFNDDLKKYIPDFPRGHEITIRHLVDNTSGLPREPNLVGTNKLSLSDEEIIDWAKKEKLEFDPGTDKLYSNVGYELLYFIIGKLNDTSFADYMGTHYFPKLKMLDSGAHFQIVNNNIKDLAKNHQFDDELVQVENINGDIYKQSMLFTTASDLQKFLVWISKPPYKSKLKNKAGIITWTGGSDGVRAHAEYNTNKNYSFVVLGNYDEIPLQKIIDDVSSIIEDKPYTMPKAVNRTSIDLPSNQIEKFIGVYDFVEADHLMLSFKLENGVLAVYQDTDKLVDLYAESESVFFANPSSNESFNFKEVNNQLQVTVDWKGVQIKGLRL